MRLLIYLLALVAGFSPAEARNAAFAAPVSVGVQASAFHAEAAPRKAHQQVLAAQPAHGEAASASANTPQFAVIESIVPQRATPQTDRLLE